MKKILIVLIIMTVIVGGYIIANLDFSTPSEAKEEKITMTQQEAEELALAEVDGEITSTVFHDGDKPYYQVTMETSDGAVIVEVDVTTKFVTTYADNISSEASSKTSEASSQSTNEEDSSEASDDNIEPELPLSKESAIKIAEKQFDGDVEKVVLVQNGDLYTYEIDLKSAADNAKVTINQKTGEVVNVDISKKASTVGSNLRENKSDDSSSKNSINENSNNTSKSNSNTNSQTTSKSSSDTNSEKATITKPTPPTPPSLTSGQE